MNAPLSTPTTTPVQPPSVLLMGAQGSGKTTSLATFLDAGVELFVIGTEPNAADSLLDAVRGDSASGRPPHGSISQVHFHAVAPAPAGWDEMIEVASTVQKNTYEQLAGIKTGIGKAKLTHWLDLLNACKDFPDDLSGKRFGDVTEWGSDRALVIDSLSGLNVMARQFTVGLKPNMAQGEWGTAMELEGGLIRKLTADRRCFFVLIAHLDRNIDDASQSTKLMPAALGNKLAGPMSKDFSEIVLSKKNVSQTGAVTFTWSTADPSADLKNRALGSSTALPPSFVPLVEAHRKRLLQSAHTTGAAA